MSSIYGTHRVSLYLMRPMDDTLSPISKQSSYNCMLWTIVEGSDCSYRAIVGSFSVRKAPPGSLAFTYTFIHPRFYSPLHLVAPHTHTRSFTSERTISIIFVPVLSQRENFIVSYRREKNILYTIIAQPYSHIHPSIFHCTRRIPEHEVVHRLAPLAYPLNQGHCRTQTTGMDNVFVDGSHQVNYT